MNINNLVNENEMMPIMNNLISIWSEQEEIKQQIAKLKKEVKKDGINNIEEDEENDEDEKEEDKVSH